MAGSTNENSEPIRELFIEELEEVTGGTDPKKTIQWLRDEIRDATLTTYGCGEELVPC